MATPVSLKTSLFRPWIGLALGAAILGQVIVAVGDTRAERLWKTRADVACRKNALSYHVAKCVVVEVNGDVLKKGVDLVLDLPDGTTVRAFRVAARETNSRSFVWRGKVIGDPLSRVIFSAGRRSVVGTIVFKARMYRLRALMNQLRAVELINPTAIPIHVDTPQGESRQLGAEISDPICYRSKTYGCLPPPEECWTDSPRSIDIMILYTQEARLQAGDDLIGNDEEMDQWISLNAEETNNSYIESNVLQRIRVVHTELATYSESGSVADDLAALTLQCDDTFDEVHLKRDTHKADAVVLITHDNRFEDNIGQAQTMPKDDVGNFHFEPCAFAVVQVDEFTIPDYFLAHELGHIMGAEHDKGSATNEGAIPESSYGYMDFQGGVDENGEACGPWMTMMAQRAACDVCDSSNPPNCTRKCTHVPLWSSPSLQKCGRPMGSQEANNCDTLNFTALTVANFRCSSPTPSDVWMKDTWDDTGGAPDANVLATEPIGQSPYIWVRNGPDNDGLFERTQHQHENPTRGQANYVYVKIHNSGSTTADGALELWVSTASGGLSWPAGFVKVASLDISFAPTTTRIAELPWTPSQSGSTCLVARWNSASDQMQTPESNNIQSNARNNNNIVARGVSVVDSATELGPASAGTGCG